MRETIFRGLYEWKQVIAKKKRLTFIEDKGYSMKFHINRSNSFVVPEDNFD